MNDNIFDVRTQDCWLETKALQSQLNNFLESIHKLIHPFHHVLDFKEF